MDFGRWLWRVVRSVRNVVVKGETGWSSFGERDAKVRAVYINRVLEEGDIVSQVGKACVGKIGVKSRWWRGVVSLGRQLGLDILMKIVCKTKVTWAGVRQLGYSERELVNIRKKELEKRIQEHGRKEWKKMGGEGNEEVRRYIEWKEDLRMERYADGSEGARVRMMMRGDSLPVRSNHTVEWKYREDERMCICGKEEESERHVMLKCELYENQRRNWIMEWRRERGEEDPMEGILGFTQLSIDLEKLVLKGAGCVWKERERRERGRVA
jgi:hypothetical protein